MNHKLVYSLRRGPATVRGLSSADIYPPAYKWFYTLLLLVTVWPGGGAETGQCCGMNMKASPSQFTQGGPGGGRDERSSSPLACAVGRQTDKRISPCLPEGWGQWLRHSSRADINHSPPIFFRLTL